MRKSIAREGDKTPVVAKQSVTASKRVSSYFQGLQTNLLFHFLNQLIQTYEGLWRFIFLMVSLLSTFLINKIYIYQTARAFDEIRKGQFIHLLIYGVPFSVFYTISDFVVHWVFDSLCEKHFINHVRFADAEARRKRCYSLVKWGFSIVYYSLSSLAAYLLLMKTSYLPTWLGGNGSPENIYNDFPQNTEFSFQIEVFYILQFGKHFSRTFCHFFIRPEGNYYQYGLHHILSLSLIIFSYTMDHWLIGTFVLLVHDFTDLTLILARGYRDYRKCSQKILQILYIVGFVSWIFCRIIIYSYAFIYGYNKGIFFVLLPKMETVLPAIYKQVMFVPVLFMSGMLIVLQGLQLFWTYYIMRSYIAVNVSAKLASHNYD